MFTTRQIKEYLIEVQGYRSADLLGMTYESLLALVDNHTELGLYVSDDAYCMAE